MNAHSVTATLVLIAFGGATTATAQEIDFPKLVKIAQSYGLPFPPKAAEPVLSAINQWLGISVPSDGRDPRFYRPAFLLQKLPDGRARVLMGWREVVVEPREEHSPGIRPFSLEEPKPRPLGYVLGCNSLTTLAFALQLAQRDRLEEAVKVWTLLKESRHIDEVHHHESTSAWCSDTHVLLGRCLYQWIFEATLREDADLKDLHAKLTRLKGEYPPLFSEKTEDSFAHERFQFVNDLGLTVAAKAPPKGSVEALLIEWGNRPSPMRHLGFFDENTEEDDRAARAIFAIGVKALPDLLRLCSDTRITRHVDPGFMNRPAYRCRLGMLAGMLAMEMGGITDLDRLIDSPPKEDAEQPFFETASLEIKDGLICEFHEVPLWILGQRHPKALLELCRRVPKQVSQNAQIFGLARHVAGSTASRDEKSDALVGLAERMAEDSRLREILQSLAKIDPGSCIKLLRRALQTFPKDVNEPYWSCQAAAYTHVVVQLEDDGIWKDYLRVAKRSSIGLRLAMMNPMNYSYIGDRNRARRLAFLAAFLDDEEVCDPASDPTRYEGPYAGFKFGRFEVRGFAAYEIASLLHQVPERPTQFWTHDQWLELVGNVGNALKKESLPNLK